MHRFPAQNLFHVPLIMCEHCVAALTDALRTIDKVVRVEADIVARTVRIVSDRYESLLLRTLKEAGFPAEPILQPLG
jgi:copper chaperone